MKIGELVTATKVVIMKMYLDETDTRDWAAAFSGGKDSTVIMSLIVSVIEALPPEKRWRKVHGTMSDTIVENPLVKTHMGEQARLVNKYCESHNIPVSVTQVHRPTKESYFVKILGLGYFLPQRNGKGRWCTDRLKIKPQNEHLHAIDPSYIVTGVRHAESKLRSQSISNWAISEFIGDHVDMKNAHTFNPIVNWTVQDVWKYLEMEGLPWGSTLSVRTIYKDATGECGFTNPEGASQVEVCGARHGCWLCPVILKDRSTEKMSEKHKWMEPLTYWRELQLRVYGSFDNTVRSGGKIRNGKIKAVTKSGTMRNGKKLEEGQGNLTVNARKYLFNELMETEKMVNRLRAFDGLAPLSLISEEEIALIKHHWEDDIENRPWLIGDPLNEILELIEQ